MNFSVLMSVYYKEKAEYLEIALNSIINQTQKPSEIVLVKDGPLAEELDNKIEEFNKKYPSLFNIVPLKKNVGLGLALAEGILHCSNELVARMDSDDFSRKDRFELQLKEFENDSSLDICGSQMFEFEGEINNILAQRTVPLTHDEIVNYTKLRDGLNHISVMFKKSSVLNAGNYQSCLLMEDSLLWANMFLNGAKAKNIDDFLVSARIGKDMFERRGGLNYYKKYKNARKTILKTGFISKWDYFISIFIQFIVCIIPNKLRGWVFKKLLHR